MVTGAEEAAAAKAAVAIVQLAQKYGIFDRLVDAFKTKHKVLVLGSTGAGKSQFLKSIESLVPATINAMERTAISSDHRVKLAGQVFDFTDTPGDPGRVARRNEAITSVLGSDRPFGLIHVVSWGLHEYQTGMAEAVGPDGAISSQWLDEHRRIEIERMTEWAPLMTGRPSYSITLVSKADLWWNRREEVLRYYEGGQYGRIMGTVASKGHSVIPYSSVFHQFYEAALMAGSFGTEDRSKCQQMLLQELFLATAQNTRG